MPVSTSISGNVLTITPNSVLAKGIAYQVLLHTGCVTSLAGNPLAGYVSRIYHTTLNGDLPPIFLFFLIF